MFLHLKEFVDIGFIRKAHSYRGQAKVVIEDPFLEDLAEQEFVFVDIEGCKVPFYIESLQENKDLVLKLEHISNPEELLPFHQKRIYLLKESLRHSLEFIKQKEQGSRFEGMEMFHSSGEKVGVIDRVEEYPQQLMAVVRHPEKGELLIPLHEELIHSVEADKIIMNLPDGLI